MGFKVVRANCIRLGEGNQLLAWTEALEGSEVLPSPTNGVRGSRTILRAVVSHLLE